MITRDAAVDWTPALDALTRGEPLPAPFNDSARLFRLLYPLTSTKVEIRAVRAARIRETPQEHVPIHPPAAAAATLSATQDPNATIAAITGLQQAAAGMPDLVEFYAQARTAFKTQTW